MMPIRILAMVATLLLVAIRADAATQLFLDVPGIPGDATFEPVAHQIQGLSYSFGISPLKASKYGTAGVCAPGQSKPVFSEFCVKKNTDIASPRLVVAAATATPFALVTISVYRGGALAADPPLVRYALANAIVSSVHADEDTAAVPTEQVCFRFNRAHLSVA
jgi:type VI protein secretion system component Hcp